MIPTIGHDQNSQLRLILNVLGSPSTWRLWTQVKDNPHISSFIPIDPNQDHAPTIEKVKAYLCATHAFIHFLPRNRSLNDRILSYVCNPEAVILGSSTDRRSEERISCMTDVFIRYLTLPLIAQLRKENDLVTVMNRLLPDIELEPEDLQDLTLSLEEGKEKLSQIEHLDLKETYIVTFPKELCPCLSHVRSIDLSANNLGHTPLRFLEDLFSLPHLESLDLSFNSFSFQGWIRIEALLPLLKNVKSINLKNTNLTKAPETFSRVLFGLPSLERADLSSNQFLPSSLVKIYQHALPKGIFVQT